jgi:hypothetical protein
VAINFVRLKSPYFFFWSSVSTLPGISMAAALADPDAVRVIALY